MNSVSLPSDVVMEIMSRVPGKSLARFRLVSKQFRSLLSDPCFLRLHHSRSRDSLFTLTAFSNELSNLYKLRYKFYVTNKANGLIHKFTEDFSTHRRPKANGLPIGEFTEDYRTHKSSIRMLSSHHQLLCFVCEGGIHLCDPLNKELKNLPNPTFSRCCNFNKPGDCLVSFGFVDATMQYKVIKWPHDLDENRTRRLPSGLITVWKKVNELKFEVLNIDIVEDGRLKVSPWRLRRRLCPYLLQLSSQVHVNGYIYWTTSDFQIVSFSLQDETFSAINPKPPCFSLDTQGSKKSSYFTLSGRRGNLWMVDYDVPSQIMEIWKMEDRRGGWANIHKINLKGTHPKKIDCKVKMLDIRSDEVLFKLSSTSKRLFICYDAKTNTLEKCGRESRDYELCHSTDGLLSIDNLAMFHACRPLSCFLSW
ncbi:F-box domain [Arabidopsis thaliana x Arabidopsis arenosa]|uniref:F-box domain n=1 Tax=Arabidopsis thaliana x Arabidopsis arenosa TaxID=1240361 RepID=A0A8T2CA16_9BRAS|nr:F-box domain [Arabidopsis thaliana x Arabidopsis arenosa]